MTKFKITKKGLREMENSEQFATTPRLHSDSGFYREIRALTEIGYSPEKVLECLIAQIETRLLPPLKLEDIPDI